MFSSEFGVCVDAEQVPALRRNVHVVALQTEKAKAYEATGRLRKRSIQPVHGKLSVVYSIYGWANGSKDRKAREATDGILNEISTDVCRAKHQPHLIVGDMNGMPEDFQQLSEVMSNAMLHAVGAMATKAGQHVNAATCWAEGSEAGSRRDFVLASTSALDMVQKLEVEEEGGFPDT